MNQAKIDEMKANAEAATPGDWYADSGNPTNVVAKGHGTIAHDIHERDAKHIASASPAKVLELIAESERLEKHSFKNRGYWHVYRSKLYLAMRWGLPGEEPHTESAKNVAAEIKRFLDNPEYKPEKPSEVEALKAENETMRKALKKSAKLACRCHPSIETKGNCASCTAKKALKELAK